MYDNVFLVKVVSFESFTLSLNNEYLEMPFETEEYRLIVAYDDYAYDLQEEGRRYYIIDMVNYVIPDEEIVKLLPNVKYVYDMYPFQDIWESISVVFGIKEDMKTYLEAKVAAALKLHEKLTAGEEKGQIIDFNVAKKNIKKRKE